LVNRPGTGDLITRSPVAADNFYNPGEAQAVASADCEVFSFPGLRSAPV